MQSIMIHEEYYSSNTQGEHRLSIRTVSTMGEEPLQTPGGFSLTSIPKNIYKID